MAPDNQYFKQTVECPRCLHSIEVSRNWLGPISKVTCDQCTAVIQVPTLEIIGDQGVEYGSNTTED